MYLLINAGIFGIDYLDNGYLNWGYLLYWARMWELSLTTSAINLGGYFPLKKKWNGLKNPKDKSPIVLAVF